MELFNYNALECSRLTTKNYSTSFSMGVHMLGKNYRYPIYALYGFVRYADEMVDTLGRDDRLRYFRIFCADAWHAIDNKFSVNPILHSFQWLVHEYHIDHDHIYAFLHSMEDDLFKNRYDRHDYETYIYGSAEVVGLMCLRIFYKDDDKEYERLKPFARYLGAAFQKINFLRDMHDDHVQRGRMYFPGIEIGSFGDDEKKQIEKEIDFDFKSALHGIRLLKKEVQFGVFLAYQYYTALFSKIKKAKASDITQKRFRVSNFRKFLILCQSYIVFLFRAV